MPSAFSKLWTLDPEITFLNHGSFGACPREVQDAQSRVRAALEREPVRYMLRDLEPAQDASRRALAEVVGSAPANLVFVTNATEGVNSVLRSLTFTPGDELLTTDHAYNACANALRYVADQFGARVVVAKIPFPLADSQLAVDAVLGAITPRTRLLLLDHVTSPTGLVLPIEPIVREAERRGVRVLVDGAHGPGMVPLALDALGASYYTGNCHKWLCAPKGVGFLHVRPDRQAEVRPLSISHGANSRRTDRSRFQLEFDWTGTADPSPVVVLADAIRVLSGLLPGGLPALLQHNRAFALASRDRICAALGVPAPAPDDMIGTLVSVPIRDGAEAAEGLDPLQVALFERYHIEIPIVPWPAPPRRLVRLASQIYLGDDDVTHLVRALQELGAAP